MLSSSTHARYRDFLVLPYLSHLGHETQHPLTRNFLPLHRHRHATAITPMSAMKSAGLRIKARRNTVPLPLVDDTVDATQQPPPDDDSMPPPPHRLCGQRSLPPGQARPISVSNRRRIRLNGSRAKSMLWESNSATSSADRNTTPLVMLKEELTCRHRGLKKEPHATARRFAPSAKQARKLLAWGYLPLLHCTPIHQKRIPPRQPLSRTQRP